MKNKKMFIIFSILMYLELVYHFFIFKTFDFKSFFFTLIFTFFTSYFIHLISNLFSYKINKYIMHLIIILFIILFEAQFINYLFYGNILSIYSILNGGQVFEYFNQILMVIFSNFIPVLLFLLPLLYIKNINKKIFIEDKDNLNKIFSILLLISLYLLTVISLNFDKNSMYSAKKLYFEKNAPNENVKTFGLLTTMKLDIQRTFIGFEEDIKEEDIKEEEIIKDEYNILDIDFNELIQNESNTNINNIHSYIKNSPASLKNEYTGMFEGYNLIYIVAEAFSPIAVDEVLTPTLYKLYNNGFKFNNFYTPIYYVSTSDGEYSTLTSLLPKENVWSMSKSSVNYLPYTFGNIFNNLNYNSYAFHNGTYRYYNRHKSHPNMGYDFMACGNGLKINCKLWPQSDLEMIDATFDKYSDDDLFMTYYLTVSGHLEYNFGGNNMSYKNKDAVKDIPYSDSIKAYMAAQIELDKALESLINNLDEKGILDNTVIMLSADHYPYGLKLSEIKEKMNIENEKFDIHKNHFFIWNNKMENTIEVNKYASSLDILPTVLNLFNIEFDSRLLIGRDILSPGDGLVIFNDRSWLNENGLYDSSKKEFKAFKDVSDNYIESINNNVYNKFVVSRNILDYDYYKFVLGGNDGS